jgi:hypothetical protein
MAKTFDQQLIDLEPTERDDLDDAEVRAHLRRMRPPADEPKHCCPPDKFPCALCYPGHGAV